METKELILNKTKIKSNLKKNIEIEVDKTNIKGFEPGKMIFKSIDVDTWKDIMELLSDNIDADAQLLYWQCKSPNIKDENFLRQNKCSLLQGEDPTEIINKIFDKEKIVEICNLLIKESVLLKEDAEIKGVKR